MFARNVAFTLRRNSTPTQFAQVFDKEVLPMLKKQKGFQDEITFAIPGGNDLIAISLWDSKENADAYNVSGYPEVLKTLSTLVEGSPKVRTSEVLNSTFHKTLVTAAAQQANPALTIVVRAGFTQSQEGKYNEKLSVQANIDFSGRCKYCVGTSTSPGWDPTGCGPKGYAECPGPESACNTKSIHDSDG